MQNGAKGVKEAMALWYIVNTSPKRHKKITQAKSKTYSFCTAGGIWMDKTRLAKWRQTKVILLTNNISKCVYVKHDKGDKTNIKMQNLFIYIVESHEQRAGRKS